MTMSGYEYAAQAFSYNGKGTPNCRPPTLRECRQLLEDLEDLAVIAERRDEPTEPWETVKACLKGKSGP